MKAAEAKGEASDEGEVEPGEVGDVEVGEPADLADWGCDGAGGCDIDGGVGVAILVAVDALGHLLVFGVGGVRRTLVVGGSEQLLVVGGWCLVSSKSYCEIGLGKSLRGGWYVCIVFELLKVR